MELTNNQRFQIRILFYLLIIGLLIWVGIRAGGNPCEKCKLKVEQQGFNGTYTCYQVMDRFVLPQLGVNRPQDNKIPEDSPNSYNEIMKLYNVS